ncbi:MFS transporter [Salipiger sp. P9]|uniref:MFS transporter n=1 Tax=Salipiger pentaromativorans TaxID=2943193 RepID=UPI002157C923|nr:MFS transporter [Salipiger pentaromativorans]MCR8547671.1 MFS transporter [Salipiger pentaromativorans]
MPSRSASPLIVLRIPAFRNRWMASLVSNLGTLVQSVGAGWMMTQISDSDAMVGLVQASVTVPMMLFAVFAGTLADNHDRRKVMIGAQLFMMAAAVLLTVLAWLGLMTPWLLILLTFLIGTGTTFFNPSWQASMGDIVPRDDLPSAVALNSMAFNAMRSVGPAVGGIIVALAGASAAFALNAVSYVAMIVTLWRWKSPAADTRLPPEPLRLAVGSGLRYVAMSPNLTNVMGRAFLFGLGSVSVLSLLPVVAHERLGGDAVTYGIMLGFFGVGAIGGAFGNGWLRERYDNEHIVRFAALAAMLGALAMSVAPTIWIALPALMLSGASWVVALSLFNVTVQLSTPRWVVGRAIALYQSAAFGGMAGGSWLWGAVSDGQGLTVSLIVAALVLAAAAAVGLKRPLPEYGGLDLSPLDLFREPMLQLDVQPRSGPIVAMTRFEIDPKDVPEFLEVMAERRRVRIRDGAQNWVLMRDLENPRIWEETYHVPTWVEYIRHNTRRTKADHGTYARLVALHRGPERPHTRRMIERHAIARGRGGVYRFDV